jgi:lysophospholipase L1-like esterase
LVFLGNRSKNDDLFYYEPENDLLIQLTATPFSEKGFQLLEKAGGLEIQTRSLWARYRYHFDPRLQQIVLLEETRFPVKGETDRDDAKTINAEYFNTFIGFGDSITWGKIDGVQRLDLCFLKRMGDLLAEIYGPSSAINLGVPGDQTFEGALRVDQDLDLNPAFYFLLMLGVNDVWRTNFSLESSLENLEFIIDAAQARQMRVIASTLTPRKDVVSLYQYYWDQLYQLSDGIIQLALRKNAATIDTLNAFMSTDPPDGWKTLLESTSAGKGNHPNAEGHLLIASLFAPALAAFPPLPPSGVQILDPQNAYKIDAQWDANFESDFSHFAFEFAYKPSPLSQQLATSDNHITFTLFPFLPELYFRLQTVDRGSHASEFSTVYSAQKKNSTQATPFWLKR